jgi:hypothetical protein
VATRAALRGIASAQNVEEFTPPQRHLVRAMHSRLSLVCVAPLGAGKWTAFRACAALANGRAIWAVPAAAVEFTKSTLSNDGYHDAAARVIAHEQLASCSNWEPAAEVRTLLLSDWHLAAEPDLWLRSALEWSADEGICIVTAEEDHRAKNWAETIAAALGRCGYISTVPYSQTRWRLVAPWRGAMLAPASAAETVTAELRRTVREGHRTRFIVECREDAGPIIARVLDDECMEDVSATIHADQGERAAVVFWNPEPEAALPVRDGEREVMWMSPHDNVELAIREATATGDVFKGACAGGFVCRDAGDVLLGSVIAEEARKEAGARTLPTFWHRVRELGVELSELEAADPAGRRALYEAVARLQINRAAAGALVDWVKNVPIGETEAVDGAVFVDGGRTFIRRWAGAAANETWASERGWKVVQIDAFGIEVDAGIAMVQQAGVSLARAVDPVLMARIARRFDG